MGLIISTEGIRVMPFTSRNILSCFEVTVFHCGIKSSCMLENNIDMIDYESKRERKKGREPDLNDRWRTEASKVELALNRLSAFL